MKQRLGTEVTSGEHPAADLLSAFAERTLRSAERDRVIDHLSRCSICRAAVALASSDNQEKPAERPLGLPLLRFPAAMRWASATAALAIAVGVGVLIHQEQSRSTPASHQAAGNVASTVASVQAPEAIAPASATAATKTHSASKESRTTLARKAPLSRAMPRGSKGTATDGIVSAAAAPPVPEAPMAQTPAADAFSYRQQPTAKARTLDTTASAPSAPAAVGSGSGAGVGGGTYPLNSAAPAKTAEVIAQPQSSASGGPVAAKRERASAFAGIVSGNVMKTPIAHWSISSTGQLQRRNLDDTLSVIEPAAGSTFRAVAAQGIEVWAGGSQTVADRPATPVLFHSSDVGTSWKQVAGPWKGTVLRIQLGSGGMVKIAAEDGEWETRDGGQSWISVSTR